MTETAATRTGPVALVEFVRVNALGLTRFAYLMTGDRVRAEDMVQDVFLAMHKRFGSVGTAPLREPPPSLDVDTRTAHTTTETTHVATIQPRPARQLPDCRGAKHHDPRYRHRHRHRHRHRRNNRPTQLHPTRRHLRQRRDPDHRTRLRHQHNLQTPSRRPRIRALLNSTSHCSRGSRPDRSVWMACK
jgi:hypothetical protein